MGLFDVFKRKAKKNDSSQTEPDKEKGKNPFSEESIKYETQLSGKNIADHPKKIKDIVDEMVKEDPFKNYYSGKDEKDMIIPSKKYFQYAEISTVNVGLIEDGKSDIKILIEGIELGSIPSAAYTEIKQYNGKNVLTAYAFITGGQFKEYSAETQKVEEGFVSYDLDIFLQYN